MPQAAWLTASLIPAQVQTPPDWRQESAPAGSFLRAEILPVEQAQSERPVLPLAQVEAMQENLTYDRQGRMLGLNRSRYHWLA